VPPRNGGKVGAIVVASVLAAGLVVAGIIVFNQSGKDDKHPQANHSTSTPSSSSSSSASADPSASAGSDGGVGPGVGAPVGGDPGSHSRPSTPSDMTPYVVLAPGKCFDVPSLDTSVSQVEVRSCDSPHDGEVVANETLTGTFSSDTEIQQQALSLCKTDATKRLRSIGGDGQTYYYYALFPSQTAYTGLGKNQVSCAITLSNKPGGKKLTAPLPS